MKRMYAVSTRLEMTGELKTYLDVYITFYNSIQRRMFYDILHDVPKDMGMSQYVSYICNTYGILKRTANSIRYDMQGRINALLELKKNELYQINVKIQSVQKKVNRLKSDINKAKFMRNRELSLEVRRDAAVSLRDMLNHCLLDEDLDDLTDIFRYYPSNNILQYDTTRVCLFLESMSERFLNTDNE